MKRIFRLFLLAFGCLLAESAVVAQQLQHVDALPNLSLPQPHAETPIFQDRKVNFSLTIRTSELIKDKNISTHAGYWFYVKKDRRVNFTVTLDRGVPMVMLCDGPMPPVITTLIPAENAPEEMETSLPCNPVAYDVSATNRTVSITVLPPHDAIWQVYIWVVHKPIVAPDPVEIDEEIKQALINQGYREEQIPLLWSELDLNMAWLVSDDNNTNQQSRDKVDVELMMRNVDGQNGVVPTQVLLDRMLAITPKSSTSQILLSQTYYDNVKELKKSTGESVVAIPQSKHLPISAYRYFPSLDPLLTISDMKNNPFIIGAMLREYEKKKALAPQIREALATLSLARGKLAEVDILVNRASLALARHLKYINGVEAILVDRDGIVLAGTRQWVYPAIHKQTSWKTLAGADGAAILVSPAYKEAPYELEVRKFAIPIRVENTAEHIGWIMVKVMDDLRFSE